MSAVLADCYRSVCTSYRLADTAAAQVAALRRLGSLWSMLSVAERIAVDPTVALWPEHLNFLKEKRKNQA